MKMAVKGARLAAPDDHAAHERVVRKWAAMLPDMDFSQSPPALARTLNRLICDETGCGDVFEEDKITSNREVMEVLPDVEKVVNASDHPLATALEAAIIGNYIDRGVDHDFDWAAELARLEKVLDEDMVREFAGRCRAGADVLVIGDNAGEIVLDTLLVRQLQSAGCRVTYSVRSHPVLNDALMADAHMVGMTDLCEVMESGVDTPGTVLERCSEAFISRMKEADVVVCKGQGNFEALHGRWPGAFFAFKAKCARVAEQTGKPVGCSVFGRF